MTGWACSTQSPTLTHVRLVWHGRTQSPSPMSMQSSYMSKRNSRADVCMIILPRRAACSYACPHDRIGMFKRNRQRLRMCYWLVMLTRNHPRRCPCNHITRQSTPAPGYACPLKRTSIPTYSLHAAHLPPRSLLIIERILYNAYAPCQYRAHVKAKRRIH